MVKTSTDKIKDFLSKTQDSILSAAFIISLLYFVSAILGLLKSRFLITYFGASSDLTMFLVADRIPSAIYTTIFLGSLSSIFIPMYVSLNKEDEAKSFKFASNLFNLVLVFFLAVSLILFIFSHEVLYLITLGQFTMFELNTASYLLRVMLFGQVILILSSFVTSILNANRNFLVSSLAPVVFNLSFLITLPFLQPFIGINAAAWGMVIGSFFHLLIQLPIFAKVGFEWHPIFNLKDRNMVHTLKLSLSSFLATLVSQIILIVETSLSLLISSASVVYFKFADQLRYFPVHLFGASIAIAALPVLSAENIDDKKLFSQTVKTSLLQIIYLSIPVSILLIILKLPLVRIVYGADKFTWEDTLMTALALGVFSLSIFSQSCTIFLSKCFYALKNSSIPLVGSILTLIATAVFPLYFIFNGYGVWVLVLSFVIGTYINLAYFLFKLKKLVPEFSILEMVNPVGKILFSGFLMAISLYFPMQYLDNYVFNTSYVLNLLLLTSIVSLIGISLYTAITYYFRVPEVILMFKILKKFRIKIAKLENLENQLNQSIS